MTNFAKASSFASRVRQSCLVQFSSAWTGWTGVAGQGRVAGLDARQGEGVPAGLRHLVTKKGSWIGMGFRRRPGGLRHLVTKRGSWIGTGFGRARTCAILVGVWVDIAQKSTEDLCKSRESVNALCFDRFAIPAFNCTSSSTINAVLEASAKHNSLVMIQFSQGGAQFIGGTTEIAFHDNACYSKIDCRCTEERSF